MLPRRLTGGLKKCGSFASERSSLEEMNEGSILTCKSFGNLPSAVAGRLDALHFGTKDQFFQTIRLLLDLRQPNRLVEIEFQFLRRQVIEFHRPVEGNGRAAVVQNSMVGRP